MRNTIVLFGALLLTSVAAMAADTDAATAKEVLGLERQAMEGWISGNPDPMLATLDPDVTYINAATNRRLEGIAAVKALFESYRGRPLFDSYEIADANVRSSGNLAILTYVLVQRMGATTSRWNGTQVYERKNAAWKVIHAHWSAAN